VKETICDLIQTVDVAIIRADDSLRTYYLARVAEVFVSQKREKDPYGHNFNEGIKLVRANYLERHKNTNDLSTVYFIEKKTALIPAFSIVGVCP